MRGLRETTATLLLAAAVLAGGCATGRPVGGAVTDWSARRERLLALEDWQARGRIAVKSDAGGGQGDLDWQQRGPAAQIRVSGPFGAGAYEIRWEPMLLSVSSRDGEFSRAWTGPKAAEQFLAEQLGWAFPAASVRYWLLGLPDPAYPAAESFAPDGRPASIVQNDWSVTYERFAPAGGLAMPARLTLQSPAARLRLAVDRWCLAAQCPGGKSR
jgi:outer membrane lipoprotein LolB